MLFKKLNVCSCETHENIKLTSPLLQPTPTPSTPTARSCDRLLVSDQLLQLTDDPAGFIQLIINIQLYEM